MQKLDKIIRGADIGDRIKFRRKDYFGGDVISGYVYMLSIDKLKISRYDPLVSDDNLILGKKSYGLWEIEAYEVEKRGENGTH